MICARITTRMAAHTDETGTTLVELIIGTVVLGIIGAATIGSLFQLLSTEKKLTDRISVSNVGDMLGVTFAADVASASGSVENSNASTAGNSLASTAWACDPGARNAAAATLMRLRQEGRFAGTQTIRFVHYVAEPAPADPTITRVVRYVCAPAGPVSQSDTLVIAQRVLTATAGGSTEGIFTTDGVNVIGATLRIEALGSNGLTNRTSVTASPRQVIQSTVGFGGGGNNDGSGMNP